MLNVLQTILWCLFRRLVRGPANEADLIALRHQVLALQRQLKIRPKLTPWDRLLFTQLYMVNPLSVRSILIVKPDTVVRWYRAGFRLFWRMKSRRDAGRPKIPVETRALIREMSNANVLWGAPRIHGELFKLGIDVSQSTVAKYMVKRAGPPSQAWKTFLQNHADGIAAIDLFVVPTVGFKLLFGLVVLDHGRRRLRHVAATHPGWSKRYPQVLGKSTPIPVPAIVPDDFSTVPAATAHSRDGARRLTSLEDATHQAR